MQSFKRINATELDPQHIMKDVYSYPFPEVREVLRTLSFDPELTMNTIPVEEAAGLLACYDFQPPLDLPSREDGSLDLDDIHTPALARIRDRIALSLPGIKTFENMYPTHGSSPSMEILLSEWKANGTITSLAVLDGEYDGYSAYAGNLDIPVEKHEQLPTGEPEEGKVWFISNPSAVDGNWIDDDRWKAFVDAGHEIVYDAAYVGLTAKKQLDVSAPNIRAVLTSPSKIFGVFRYRDTGTTFTREPVGNLYGSKWFKDVPALLETLKLYESFGPNELHDKYVPVQELICASLVDVVGCEVEPSDVLLLGNTDQQPSEEYSNFKRGLNSVSRFGLTKFFEDIEKQQRATN